MADPAATLALTFSQHLRLQILMNFHMLFARRLFDVINNQMLARRTGENSF